MSALQLDMLDLMSPALPNAIKRPVDPAGEVVQGEVDETLTLPHPRLAWARASIELHYYEGMWMWATSHNLDGCGGGYRVGPKWGNFARTRDDALALAIDEIKSRLSQRADRSEPAKKQILSWLQGLKLQGS